MYATYMMYLNRDRGEGGGEKGEELVQDTGYRVHTGYLKYMT